MSIKAEGVLGCDVTSMSKCGTVVSLFYPQEDSFLLIKNERTSHETTYGSILVPNPLLTPSSPIYRATIALTRPSWSASVGGGSLLSLLCCRLLFYDVRLPCVASGI